MPCFGGILHELVPARFIVRRLSIAHQLARLLRGGIGLCDRPDSLAIRSAGHRIELFRLLLQLGRIFIGHPHRVLLGDITGEPGRRQDILRLGLLDRGLYNRGGGGDLQLRPALDLVQREGDQVVGQRLVEVVADHQLFVPAVVHQRQFLPVGAREHRCAARPQSPRGSCRSGRLPP